MSNNENPSIKPLCVTTNEDGDTLIVVGDVPPGETVRVTVSHNGMSFKLAFLPPDADGRPRAMLQAPDDLAPALQLVS